MKVDDLLLLAEVLGAGSLSATARALNTPKATLSRRLAALEAAVGQRLFVPGARSLQLTQFGQALAERAQRHRDELEETQQWIGAHEAVPRGLLRLSVGAELATILLAEPMARFVQRYPEVRLDIDTSPRRVDLRKEPFDLVIRIGPLEDSDLVARPLIQLQRGFYASPLYLNERAAPRSPADLAEHQVVMLSQAIGFEHVLTNGRKRVPFVPQGRVQTNSVGLLRALTLAGTGIASFPHGLVRNDVADGRLIRLLPDWEFNPLPVTLLTTSRKLLPAKVRAFIDHLMETAPGWAL